MKAIILSAGIGSRLGPLTVKEPKCLLPIGTSTILHRQIAMLQGVRDRRDSRRHPVPQRAGRGGCPIH